MSLALSTIRVVVAQFFDDYPFHFWETMWSSPSRRTLPTTPPCPSNRSPTSWRRIRRRHRRPIPPSRTMRSAARIMPLVNASKSTAPPMPHSLGYPATGLRTSHNDRGASGEISTVPPTAAPSISDANRSRSDYSQAFPSPPLTLGRPFGKMGFGPTRRRATT